MHALHLEDSPEDSELVHVLLRAEWPDCRITRVETRQQFETALQSGDFDVILSDNTLPNFDGNSALEWARVARPRTPFIFLSGTLGEERAIEALRRGAADYVVKDRPARLVPAIRQALARLAETSRRERIEAELRQNQELFRQIAENVADMIAVVDLDGHRVYNNPAYRELFGASATQRGTDSFSEIHPEDRDRIRQVFEETVRTGHGQRVGFRQVLHDGSVRHVESQGSVIRDPTGRIVNVLVVSRDVTVRRNAEIRLEEQAALLDKADDAILVRDLAGHVTYWNKGAERLYGWTAAEIAQLQGDARLHRLPEQYQAAQREVLAHGEWTGELHQVTKTGRDIWVHSRWTLLRAADGKPTSILTLSSDITEQRKLETQLLRAQRLESIGMLAGGIAHDLNNVLAPILMSVNLLQQQAADGESRRLLDILESSAQRGAGLVRQVLTFARGADGEHVELPLQPVIQEVAKLLGETLPRSIDLITELPNDLWPVSSNSTQFGQVLMNLCVNARDAMPEGGILAIRARNLSVDDAMARANPGARPGPHVLIAVTDTGSGIPAEILEHIFDPFFTTKAAGKGTGLGLSTVLGIVKSHGGFLQVESRERRGTEFRLHFPAVAATATGSAPKIEAQPARGRGETVLVVEDEEGVRKIAEALLESRNYRALVAPDGPTAIELYRQHREKIGAVLTDMMMPAMQGAEVVAALRAINPDVRIVVMSGMFDQRSTIVAEPGRLAFLQKPMTGEQLVGALQSVIDRGTGP